MILLRAKEKVAQPDEVNKHKFKSRPEKSGRLFLYPYAG
jgi:hypothetical protein